jgi:hypothetical protein
MFRLLCLIALAAALSQCGPAPAPSASAPQPDTPAALPAVWASAENAPKLGSYWYQGKAEISRFALQQHRYRDVHPGEAVLIMVTEDFLTDKQVKNDRYKNPNSIPVLKTNFLTHFTTGLYDYSIMTSVFSPVDVKAHPHTLKVTHSSQDWCGQTFMQVNLGAQGYRAQVRSYFEEEADTDTTVPAVVLEDELFNRIRMHPGSLPVGKIQVLPGATLVRLLHKEFKPLEVAASLSPYTGADFSGEQLQAYRLYFPALERTLEIVFEQAPPHLIAGWTDDYPGFDKVQRRTIARRTHLLLDDYWQHNAAADSPRRKELGLD